MRVRTIQSGRGAADQRLRERLLAAMAATGVTLRLAEPAG